MSLVQELRRRRNAALRLHPLDSGVRDPWGEAPPPQSPTDPRVIAAVVLATGGPAHYDLDALRAAYMATDDPDERRAIDAAARVQLHRDGVPA